jgi:hypothetical protein
MNRSVRHQSQFNIHHKQIIANYLICLRGWKMQDRGDLAGGTAEDSAFTEVASGNAWGWTG